MNDLSFLNTLQEIVADRLRNPTAASYTARLAAAGKVKVAQKLGEEAVELVLAAVAEDRARVRDEAADLLFHLLVMLTLRELSLADVVGELERRHEPTNAR